MPKTAGPPGRTELTDDPSDGTPRHPHKETTMNTFENSLSRDLTCALAATLITAVMGLSFLSSTAVAPGSHSAAHTVALQPQHAWFGQPEPAVLVD
jgi:hypothetical protein